MFFVVGITGTCKRLAVCASSEQASEYIETLPNADRGIYYIDGPCVDPVKLCEHENVTFKGHIAAPGYGQSYECDDCGEAMWSACNMKPIPYADLDEPPELSKEDII